MYESLRVIDDFCPQAPRVRESALQAGFGTWRPNQGEVGSSVYDGMGFWGDHSLLIASLQSALGCPIAPNAMFFRSTNEETEPAYVHSDRDSGACTCIVYLSEHEDEYGTGFYRHRATGLTEMPPMAELRENPAFEQLKIDMVEGGEKEWERIAYVDGRFNRAVIFHAPLFHARNPRHGFGTTAQDGRMVWACHFHTPATMRRE